MNAGVNVKMEAGQTRLERLQSMVKREEARVKALVANDRQAPVKKGKGKRPAARVEIAAPTPERIEYYEVAPVRTDKGQVLGQAYRARPHFEQLHAIDVAASRREKREAIFTIDAMAALRFYRSSHEGCRRSEMRCALDVQPRVKGGGDVPHSIVMAQDNLKRCESGMGQLIDIMRMICLQDMTYEQVAMARYGSRNVDWIIAGKTVNRPKPKSTRHTARVKAEFLAGLGALVKATGPMMRTG